MKKLYGLFVLIFILFVSCGKNYSPEDEKYINEIEEYREAKNNYMKNNPDSPFNQDPKAAYQPLNYYEPNPEFVFKSKLNVYEKKDTIIILGTKGEERKVIKYGFLTIKNRNKNYRINLYKSTSIDGQEYYSIWFTDKTTGEETYGVGRYLDFELNPEKDFIYTIDFNLAYNPYCAYSAEFSCAIPTKEDYLDLVVEAGEKNFH